MADWFNVIWQWLTDESMMNKNLKVYNIAAANWAVDTQHLGTTNNQNKIMHDCCKAKRYNILIKEERHTHFVWFLQSSSNIYSDLLLQQTFNSVPDTNYKYRPSAN